MKTQIKRRDFLKSATAAGVTAMLSKALVDPNSASSATLPASKPIVISSGNGREATAKAMELILQGKDALDAIIAGVNIVEDDPKDNSVGYGGLPNEEGVVQLDSCVMDGPTHRSGAVAALERIKNPSSVALLVSRRTDHCLLVGEGALKFARAHGCKE